MKSKPVGIGFGGEPRRVAWCVHEGGNRDVRVVARASVHDKSARTRPHFGRYARSRFGRCRFGGQDKNFTERPGSGSAERGLFNASLGTVATESSTSTIAGSFKQKRSVPVPSQSTRDRRHGRDDFPA